VLSRIVKMQAVRKTDQVSGQPGSCRNCPARQQGLCGVLGPKQFALLAREARHVRRAAGEELMADAMPIGSYASLVRGVVKLTKVLEDGRQQIVGLQFAPDLVGRPFASESRVSVSAASDVELCIFPRQTLEALMNESAALERRVMLQALRELDEARDWMVTLGRKSAAEKVASFLYLAASHAGPTDKAPGARFDLPLSRGDIADFLGLTIETVSRQISRFRADGVIGIEKRHVSVPDLARLRLRCG